MKREIVQITSAAVHPVHLLRLLAAAAADGLFLTAATDMFRFPPSLHVSEFGWRGLGGGGVEAEGRLHGNPRLGSPPFSSSVQVQGFTECLNLLSTVSLLFCLARRDKEPGSPASIPHTCILV